MTGLAFDVENHVYTLDGRVLPSVTQIIRRVLGEHNYGATDWHMERGTAAHELYALLARGEELSKYDYDQRLQPQVDAWRDWAAREKPQFMVPEWRLASVKLGYAGTLDLVCRLGGGVCILDYKATATKRDAIQLAAYLRLLKECKTELSVKSLCSLQIDENGWRYGQYLEKSEMMKAEADWLHVLGVYRLLEKEV